MSDTGTGRDAATVLAKITGRPRSEFVPDKYVPDFGDQSLQPESEQPNGGDS